MKFMHKINPFIIMAICSIGILIAVCIPLLFIARFSYPVADDLHFGAVVYHIFLRGGSLWEAICAAANQAYEYWFEWQGSYAAIFLFAFQPGVLGTQYYILTPYIMIGSLLFSQWFILYFFLRKLGKCPIHCVVCVWSFLLIYQLLFIPYPSEAFYWYNGSVYYTFFYALSLLYIVFLSYLLFQPILSQAKKVIMIFLTIVLGLTLGGGNLPTALSTCMIGCGFLLITFLFHHKRGFLLLPAILLEVVGLILNVAAPGNHIRQADIGEHLPAIKAIWLAISHSFLNIYSWTNLTMVLLLLIIAPIIWKSVRHIPWDFRYPLVFIVFSFGVYASQLAPMSYVDGTYGPYRMGDILWESYCLFIIVIEIYLIGWLRQKKLIQTLVANMHSKTRIFLYWSILGLSLLIALRMSEQYKKSTFFLIYRDWNYGKIQDYGIEMDQRQEQLLDPSIKDVSIRLLQNQPFVLYSNELNGPVNLESAARFYGKNSVSCENP